MRIFAYDSVLLAVRPLQSMNKYPRILLSVFLERAENTPSRYPNFMGYGEREAILLVTTGGPRLSEKKKGGGETPSISNVYYDNQSE